MSRLRIAASATGVIAVLVVGVVILGETAAPWGDQLGQAMQLRLKSGRIVVLDGPFTETKEVLGGFAIFELPDMAAAEASARQFLDLHLKHAPAWHGRCEIRQVAGSQVELIRGAA